MALAGVGAFVGLGLERLGAFLAHGFIDEEADAFGKAAGAFFIEELQNGIQKFRIALVGHFGFELDVFARHPNRKPAWPALDQFFARGAPPPLRGSAALGSLRSPSLRLTPEGWRRREERQFTERLLHPREEPEICDTARLEACATRSGLRLRQGFGLRRRVRGRGLQHERTRHAMDYARYLSD